MSMTVMPGVVRDSRERARTRSTAALVAVWVLIVAAVYVGHTSHSLTLQLGAIFLLWRVWSGGRVSLALLRLQAVIGAGVATAMTIAAVMGTGGLVVATLWAASLYAATGLLLFSPVVGPLRRDGIDARR